VRRLAPLTPAHPTAIPKILHQTWKRADIPFEFIGFVDSWRRHHPQWEYRLWTDEDNRRFIAAHYPEFLASFDAYTQPIQRADAVRYFLLHHFGGLYVDLDFRACRPIDPLLAGHDCVLGLEPEDHSRIHQRPRIVGNAFLAAAPRHPFFAEVIRRLPEFSGRPTALESTGPFMLSDVFDAFEQPETVWLAPSEPFYPLTLEQADRFRATGHSEVDLSAAYAIHFHRGTWWRASSADVA
jgi:inositol phosphorylceramide mannosyltransferase catalytic subunit